jgi:hypothetical protein
MFCVTPNLLCGPALFAVHFIGYSKSPEDTVGGGKGGSFDVGCPSFAEERGGDLDEGFAVSRDQNRAEDMISVTQFFAWENINSGRS